MGRDRWTTTPSRSSRVAHLQTAPDCSLGLTVTGYEFPEIESGLDANWLMIDMEAVAGSERWRAKEPALETTELTSLVSWLRGVAGANMPRAHFEATEPNLSFIAVRHGDWIRLTTLLRLEFAQPDVDADHQFEGNALEFTLRAEDLSRFADELGAEAARFPVRPPSAK